MSQNTPLTSGICDAVGGEGGSHWSATLPTTIQEKATYSEKIFDYLKRGHILIYDFV
jgi:hypothetical protein